MIPCYNSADFVGDAIRSALDQSWEHVEVVVVDDASSDASGSVIRSFGGRVRPIRLESNKGGAFARNRGAAESTGRFLLFLDADDVLGANAVAGMVEASLANPGTIAACPFSYLVADDDGWRSVAARPRIFGQDDQLLGWLEGNWTPPCSLLWPRDIFESVGGWTESLTRNDDGDTVMRALCRGVRITSAASGEALYRRHRKDRPSVSTMRKSDAHLRSAIRVLTHLSGELAAQGRLQQYSAAISEDAAEIALLAFRAGLISLALQIVEVVHTVRSHQAPPQELTEARIATASSTTVALQRLYALKIRSVGQARRWMKRRWG